MVLTDMAEFEDKLMLKWGSKQWLETNSILMQRWMDDNVSAEDRKPFKEHILRDELQTNLLIKVLRQYDKPDAEKVKELIDDLVNYRGKLWLVVGAKRTGKTAFIYRLTEHLYKMTGGKERIWWFGPPTKLPPFIEGSTLNEHNLPPVCTIIADEAGIQFWSRMSGGNTDDFLRKLPVIAHTSRNVIVITQSMAITDLNFVRLADAIFYKSYSVFQNSLERLKMSSQLQLFMPRAGEPEKVMFYDSRKLYTLSFKLPEWWNDDYSKPYKHFTGKAEMYRFILLLIKDGIEKDKVLEQAQLRGADVEPLLIEMCAVMLEHKPGLLGMKDDKLVDAIDNGFDDTPLQDVLKGREMHGFKGSFEMAPIQLKIKEQRELNPSFQLASQLPANKIMAEDMAWRHKHEGNIMIMIYGQTGTGKSGLGLSSCECTQMFNKRPMSIERVGYTPDDIVAMLAKSKKGDCHMKDEEPREWGPGSGRAQGELLNVEETIRKQQKNFVFIAPHPTPYHLHHYMLETWGIDFKNDLIRALLYLPGNMQIPLGYVVLRWPGKKLWADYGKLKDKFLEKVEQRTTSSKVGHEKIAKEMANDAKYQEVKAQKAKARYIHWKHPNLTGEEAETIRDMIEFMD